MTEIKQTEQERTKIGKEIEQGYIKTKSTYDRIKSADRKASAGVIIGALCYNILFTLIWAKDHLTTLKTFPNWFMNKIDVIREIIEKTQKLYSVLIIIALVVTVLIVLYFGFKYIKKKIGECRTDGQELFLVSIQASIFFVFFPISVYICEKWEIPFHFVTIWIISGVASAVILRLFLKRVNVF